MRHTNYENYEDELFFAKCARLLDSLALPLASHIRGVESSCKEIVNITSSSYELLVTGLRITDHNLPIGDCDILITCSKPRESPTISTQP